MYDIDPTRSMSRNVVAHVSAPAPARALEKMANAAEAQLALKQRRDHLANLIYQRLSYEAIAALPVYVGRYELWWTTYIDGDPRGPINSIANGPTLSLVDRAIAEMTPAWDVTSIAWDSFTFARYVLWSNEPISKIPWMSKQLAKAVAWAIGRLGALALNTIRRESIRAAGRAVTGAFARVAATFTAAAASGPGAPVVAAIGVIVNGVWIALDGYMIWSAIDSLAHMRETLSQFLAESVLPDPFISDVTQ